MCSTASLESGRATCEGRCGRVSVRSESVKFEWCSSWLSYGMAVRPADCDVCARCKVVVSGEDRGVRSVSRGVGLSEAGVGM